MSNTSTSRIRRRLTLGLGATAAALSISVLGAGAAHAQASPTPEQAAKIEQLCSQVPTLEGRIEAALGRINGGADVRGSLAWLEAKIAAAEAAGRTDAVAALQDRLAARTAAAGKLTEMLEKVASVAAKCDAWGAAQ
jgi:hypothetical protein